jgi:hypothetical protein
VTSSPRIADHPINRIDNLLAWNVSADAEKHWPMLIEASVIVYPPATVPPDGGVTDRVP